MSESRYIKPERQRIIGYETERKLILRSQQGPPGPAGPAGTTADYMLKTTNVIDGTLQNIRSNTDVSSCLSISTEECRIYGRFSVYASHDEVGFTQRLPAIPAPILDPYKLISAGGIDLITFNSEGLITTVGGLTTNGFIRVYDNLGHATSAIIFGNPADLPSTDPMLVGGSGIDPYFWLANADQTADADLYFGNGEAYGDFIVDGALSGLTVASDQFGDADDSVRLTPYNDGTNDWWQVSKGKGLVADQIMVGGTGGYRWKAVGNYMTCRNNADSADWGVQGTYLRATSGVQAQLVNTYSVETLKLQSHNFTTADNAIEAATGTFSHSTGEGNGLVVMPTMNTTGTASANALVVDLKGTLGGSGVHNIADFRTAGVSKASIASNGLMDASYFRTANSIWHAGLNWHIGTSAQLGSAMAVNWSSSAPYAGTKVTGLALHNSGTAYYTKITDGSTGSGRLWVAGGDYDDPGLVIGTTGIYVQGNGYTVFKINGDVFGKFTSAYEFRSNFDGFSLRNDAVSATVPVYTFAGDASSGLGRAAAQQPSLIANSVEALRVAESGGSAWAWLSAPISAIADATLKNGSISFSLDETLGNLVATVKNSSGTVASTHLPFTTDGDLATDLLRDLSDTVELTPYNDGTDDWWQISKGRGLAADQIQIGVGGARLKDIGDAGGLYVRTADDSLPQTITARGLNLVNGAYNIHLSSGTVGTMDFYCNAGHRLRQWGGTGEVSSLETEATTFLVRIPYGLGFVERSTDPPKPAEGKSVIWQSDGTGLGDDGDVMIASTAGGVTNYSVLFDHSAGTLWS